jgi:3-dehydroquinate synthase
VAADPTEKGLRKILNFGHTLGHAVETYFLEKKRLLHGEAIAVGMICEAFMAKEKGLIDEEFLEEIEAFVFSVYGKVPIEIDQIPEIISYTYQDKKNRGSQVMFSLLDGRGSCGFNLISDKREMKKALLYYIG